jgi:hypothetical protein
MLQMRKTDGQAAPPNHPMKPMLLLLLLPCAERFA